MNNQLLNKIDQFITDNSNRMITGPLMNQVLKSIVIQNVAQVTYTQLATFVSESLVCPGTVYKITDRGDRGIFVMGLTNKSVSKEGIRLMLCPKTYALLDDEENPLVLDGNHWKGVWFDDKTAAVGDLFIYGGKVWRNLTGNIGTADDYASLNATDWQLVPKNSFTNHEYIEMQFSIVYDFANDWIEKQLDENDNKVGVSYKVKEVIEDQLGIPFHNPTDISDWNMDTLCHLLVKVDCPYGFVNNEFDNPVLDVQASGMLGNKCNHYRNIKIWAGAFEDFELFTIANNRCGDMLNIESSMMVKDIPDTVDAYIEQSNDESFYYEIGGDYPGIPLSVGNPIFVNCILHKDVVLTELCIKGIGLTDTEGAPLSNTSATISVGIEVDDPFYIPNTTLVTQINGSGVKVNTMSNPTSAPYRRIRIEAFGSTIVEGRLKITGKYL